VSAPWATVKFLRENSDVLGELERLMRETSRPAQQSVAQGTGGRVRGNAPHLSCLPADKWIAGNDCVPRAIIPPFPQFAATELSESEQRESFDVQADGAPLNPRAHRRLVNELPRITKNAEGELEYLGDGLGENQDQARALYGLGLESRAQRLACCRRFARRIECARGHAFLQTFRCGLRFCRTCAPYIFQELFAKHVGLEKLVEKRPHWVLARLDFTIRNTGEMPSADVIRQMNRLVRKTLKRLLKGKKGWGYLWCDEFGFENTNLHCHGLYYGPYLPHDRLLLEWKKQTGDNLRISIQSTSGDFRKALYHLLKYVSKPPASNPQHLAQLEAAFSGVRRVHTLGLFYNPDLASDDDPKDLRCPHCDGYLSVVGGYCPASELEASGLVDVESARREVGRQRIFGRAGPP